MPDLNLDSSFKRGNPANGLSRKPTDRYYKHPIAYQPTNGGWQAVIYETDSYKEIGRTEVLTNKSHAKEEAKWYIKKFREQAKYARSSRI